MQWNKGIYDTDVLGSTVESARSAVESALYALENPLSLSADISDEARAAKQKEREFYEEFLKLLKSHDVKSHVAGTKRANEDMML